MKNATEIRAFEKVWKKWNRIEDQLLQKELRKFNHLGYAPNPNFYKILYCKINNRNPLRAKFIFILYLYLKNEKKKTSLIDRIKKFLSQFSFSLKKNTPIPKAFFYSQFPFILEVIISIQYYHNQILDGKSQVYTSSTINKNLIKGNLLKDQLYRYIEDINLCPEFKTQLVQTVRKIFELVDLGQYIERELNIYSSYKEIIQTGYYKLPFQKHIMPFIDQDLMEEVIEKVKSITPLDENHTAFLRLYLYRIFLTNTTLF